MMRTMPGFLSLKWLCLLQCRKLRQSRPKRLRRRRVPISCKPRWVLSTEQEPMWVDGAPHSAFLPAAVSPAGEVPRGSASWRMLPMARCPPLYGAALPQRQLSNPDRADL